MDYFEIITGWLAPQADWHVAAFAYEVARVCAEHYSGDTPSGAVLSGALAAMCSDLTG